MDYEKYELGDVPLLSGEKLNSAYLIYKTYGKLNKNCSNVIVLPTFYTGTHIRNEGFKIELKHSIPELVFIFCSISYRYVIPSGHKSEF